MDKVEFKVGDSVTFHPYDIAIKSKVIDIIPTSQASFVEGDTRIFYLLTGADNKRGLMSRCTGRSIKESIYFGKFEQ